MAGLHETLGSPWIPLPVRPCFLLLASYLSGGTLFRLAVDHLDSQEDVAFPVGAAHYYYFRSAPRIIIIYASLVQNSDEWIFENFISYCTFHIVLSRKIEVSFSCVRHFVFNSLFIIIYYYLLLLMIIYYDLLLLFIIIYHYLCLSGCNHAFLVLL
jgi:hypothetical protein